MGKTGTGSSQPGGNWPDSTFPHHPNSIQVTPFLFSLHKIQQARSFFAFFPSTCAGFNPPTPAPLFFPDSLGLIDSRGTVMLASEISWGSAVAGGRGGTAVLPAGVGAAFGSVAGAGSSEVRGSVGLGGTLWSTGGALGLWAVVPELLLFCRSLRVSRGGGCCFSLQGEREQGVEQGTEMLSSTPEMETMGRDARLHYQVLTIALVEILEAKTAAAVSCPGGPGHPGHCC